jgi:hypothetical protein
VLVTSVPSIAWKTRCASPTGCCHFFPSAGTHNSLFVTVFFCRGGTGTGVNAVGGIALLSSLRCKQITAPIVYGHRPAPASAPIDIRLAVSNPNYQNTSAVPGPWFLPGTGELLPVLFRQWTGGAFLRTRSFCPQVSAHSLHTPGAKDAADEYAPPFFVGFGTPTRGILFADPAWCRKRSFAHALRLRVSIQATGLTTLIL